MNYSILFAINSSNCVINLSPNKGDVLREAYRVLKVRGQMLERKEGQALCYVSTQQDGGEMYFSDIYSNMAVPKALKENKVLWGG